ncbi:MAG: hypothetical protein FJX25_15760 [Alphaproteobacteria bacterium]|nr:hypothetical protein [Alphaproteobacteria bacterium]
MTARLGFPVVMVLVVAACGGSGGNGGGSERAPNALAAPNLPGLDSTFEEMFLPSLETLTRPARQGKTAPKNIPTSGRANYTGYALLDLDHNAVAEATGRMVLTSDFSSGRVAGRAGEFRRNNEQRVPGEVTFQGKLDRQTGSAVVRAQGNLEPNGYARTVTGEGHTTFSGSKAQSSYTFVRGQMDNGRRWSMMAAGDRAK